MSDDPKTDYDPADQSPAEGQSRDIPEASQGKSTGIDPAAKDEPAEGGRDEVEDESAPGQRG